MKNQQIQRKNMMLYLKIKILRDWDYTAKKIRTIRINESNLERDLVRQNRNKILRIITHPCFLVGRNCGEINIFHNPI